MLLRNFFIASVFLLSLASCRQETWRIVQATSVKIPVDSSAELIADKDYQAFILPYKQQIDSELNTVIGRSATAMAVARPESLLSNFSADMLREAASEKLDTIIDIAIVNVGGLRTQLPKGDITKRHIFELMPFENELVVLWLRGEKLSELLDIIASVGGEGISGIKMGIKNNNAVNVLINGQPLEPDKLYAIATNDFLAGGNDKLTPLAEYERRVDSGLKLRNVYIDYIVSKTQKGGEIQSKLDKRIYYVD
ncbi:MAG: 5'-nucleotidase C-terminal domain-containing protein [Prevotellaceae bacterium]|jgi:2',3'-cyclic-nucleotide 2'-phosphodiesterase (5'-nucleotidase family)|nr:5'-nucleotidase C-terminal domain-containing protein [Prevotellaceae bacterium]